MKTAEELFLKHFSGLHYEDVTKEKIQLYAIEFAKIHVDAALNYANENVRYDYSDIEIIQDLILSAYPESNIK